MICEEKTVSALMEKTITLFENEVNKHKEIIEIDSKGEDDKGNAYLKIVNHALKCAFRVPLSEIINHYAEETTEDLVRALMTGEFIKLYGVTRIVGYYSRIPNWNKSKISELNDRHKGVYWHKKEKEIKDESLDMAVLA